MSEWKDLKNQPKKESVRILSTDKLEIKSDFKDILVENILKNNITTNIFKRYRITKEYMNRIEQKNREKKTFILTKTETKKIISETTEKKIFRSPDMKYCEDIVREEIITEFDNGDNPIKDIHEIQRKKRYFKTINYKGEPKNEKDGYIINTVIKLYQREDETDETGNIIVKEGVEREVGQKIIKTVEERHIINTIRETAFEKEESYEYKNEEKTEVSKFTQAFQGIGVAIAGSGLSLIRIPAVGGIFLGTGLITATISTIFRSNTIIVVKRRKKIIFNKYLITYNIFSDHTREVFSKDFIEPTITYSEWEEVVTN